MINGLEYLQIEYDKTPKLQEFVVHGFGFAFSNLKG